MKYTRKTICTVLLVALLAPFIGLGSVNVAFADNAAIEAKIAQLEKEIEEYGDTTLDDEADRAVENLQDEIDKLRKKLIVDVSDATSSNQPDSILNEEKTTDASLCKQLQQDIKILDTRVEEETRKVDVIVQKKEEIEESNRYNRFLRKSQNDDLSQSQSAEFAAMKFDIEDLESARMEQRGVLFDVLEDRSAKLEKYTELKCISTFNNMKPVEAHVNTTQYPGRIFDGEGLIAGADKVRGNIKGVSNSRDLPRLIIGWVKFGLEFLIVIAVIAIVYAGILMITDFGDGGRKEQGQKIITYVVIGLIVIMASYAIVNTIITQQLDL